MKSSKPPFSASPNALETRVFDEAHTWPRLFIENQLKNGDIFDLSAEQTHYLCTVLRAQEGDSVRLFNGIDGDWQAIIRSKTKKTCAVELKTLLRAQKTEPDLVLCCAPIKKQHFDDILMKATELGVAAIRPILTARTQIRELNLERAKLIVQEAAEQSERLTCPKIYKPLSLNKIMDEIEADRPCLLCAESGAARPLAEHLIQNKQKLSQKIAFFTGPEGGFTPDELATFAANDRFAAVRLGPRILRADTAALAALSCWQALCGDWQSTET